MTAPLSVARWIGRAQPVGSGRDLSVRMARLTDGRVAVLLIRPKPPATDTQAPASAPTHQAAQAASVPHVTLVPAPVVHQAPGVKN